MLTAVVLALALLAGAHPAAVVIVGAAVLKPTVFLAGAVGWALYHARQRARLRRSMPAVEADYLRAVAAEIEAGSSLRRALTGAAAQAPHLRFEPLVRLAAAGRPMTEVAALLQQVLPLNGRMAAAACRLVSETGARASGVFAGLAVRAAVMGDVERERRVLSAQARLTAWIIGGLPAAATAVLLMVGRGPAGGGPGRLLTGIGLTLVGAGCLMVLVMVRSR